MLGSQKETQHKSKVTDSGHSEGLVCWALSSWLA